MSRGQRLTFLGIAAVIAVVAVIVLAGGDDSEDGSSNTAATATATPSATAATGGAAAEEGTPTPTPTPKPVLLKAGSEKALNYEQGETVRFRVTSDVPEEIHVHGYDITKEVPAGETVTVSFKADINGIFEIEFHNSGAVLAQLKVVP